MGEATTTPTSNRSSDCDRDASREVCSCSFAVFFFRCAFCLFVQPSLLPRCYCCSCSITSFMSVNLYSMPSLCISFLSYTSVSLCFLLNILWMPQTCRYLRKTQGQGLELWLWLEHGTSQPSYSSYLLDYLATWLKRQLRGRHPRGGTGRAWIALRTYA